MQPRNALSAAANQRLAAARAELAALEAIGRLALLLDPAGSRKRWPLAGEIEQLVKRFEAAAWPRIKSGSRQPKDNIETQLVAICQCGKLTRDRRRIFDLLN